MKPYGIPRTPDLISPDIADIQEYGLKSSTGRLPGKPYKSYIRDSRARKRARRRWKKSERQRQKNILRDQSKE